MQIHPCLGAWPSKARRHAQRLPRLGAQAAAALAEPGVRPVAIGRLRSTVATSCKGYQRVVRQASATSEPRSECTARRRFPYGCTTWAPAAKRQKRPVTGFGGWCARGKPGRGEGAGRKWLQRVRGGCTARSRTGTTLVLRQLRSLGCHGSARRCWCLANDVCLTRRGRQGQALSKVTQKPAAATPPPGNASAEGRPFKSPLSECRHLLDWSDGEAEESATRHRKNIPGRAPRGPSRWP